MIIDITKTIGACTDSADPESSELKASLKALGETIQSLHLSEDEEIAVVWSVHSLLQAFADWQYLNPQDVVLQERMLN